MTKRGKSGRSPAMGREGSNAGSNQAGYRLSPAAGAVVRSDIVDVYVFRVKGARVGEQRRGEVAGGRGQDDKNVGRRVEFLQLLRASEPLMQTWHPVMGHMEDQETAAACAVREAHEELGLVINASGTHKSDARGRQPGVVLGMWALEQVHPYFISAINTIVISPRFAVQVRAEWTPRLNEEHSDYRWVPSSRVSGAFMWPGQASACREVVQYVVKPTSAARAALRLF